MSTITVITGGSRGLGRNAALHLARKGHHTVLTYHSRKDEADAAVAEIEKAGAKAVALQLDTRDVPSFPAFAETLGATLKETWDRPTFDHLVNNAGFGAYASFAETTETDLDAMLDVHVKGVFFLTQELLPHVEDGGKILNVSSGLARFALPGFSAYALAKGAVEVMTRYLAKELGDRRIAVNTLAPGAIETDFGGGLVRDNQEVNQHIASTTAMGRAGLPDDIGGAIAAILTGDTGWMTGQRIEVSGGQNL